MAIVSRGRAAWPRVLLSVAWACWPAFLFYLLVLQLPVFSRARLGFSALLVPVFAFVAYRTAPRLNVLSRRDWTALLVASGIFSALAGSALSQIPEKTYLLYPQQRLSIEAVQFTNNQVLQLKWFHTSLGDVSFDSFRDASGWKRSENALSLTSSSSVPLAWVGRTGEQTSLAFSGSRGVVIKVNWDGDSRTIDLGQTGGNAVAEHSFVSPWWRSGVLGLLLWGASLYIAVMILLNSEIRWPVAYLPSWAAWTLLTGFALSIILLVWNVPLPTLQLVLVLALTSLLVAPAYGVAEPLGRLAFLRTATSQAGHALQKNSTVLIFGCSLVLALSIFGRSIWTNWAIFDDHEIMLFLGPDRALSFTQILRALPQTEIGQYGISTRFRPSYWFLRLLECVVWGAHPYYWHAFRILILVFALGLFWILLSPSLGWLGAGLLCAYALTFPYWREVIGYLGPGETYAVAGLPIYIWGLAKQLSGRQLGRKTPVAASVAVFLGSVICIGSKENFVLLVVPSAYLAYKALRAKDSIALPGAVGSIFFAAYVGSSVLLAVNRGGVDVYSHSVAPSARIAHVFNALQTAQDLAPLLTLSALTIALSALSLPHRFSKEKRKSVLWAQFWLATFCLIYLSQLVFYNGLWPTDTRYDFPGILYIPAAVFVLFRLGVRLLPAVQHAAALPAARTSLVIALLSLVIARGYNPTIQFIANNVDETNRFVSRLESIASVLREHADYALVIESGSSADYEPVFSYEEYLRGYGVKNSLFLRIHGYSLETAQYNQEAKLIADLVQLSAHGGNGFDPLSELGPLGEKCFSLNLSGRFGTDCQPIN